MICDNLKFYHTSKVRNVLIPLKSAFFLISFPLTCVNLCNKNITTSSCDKIAPILSLLVSDQ
jgi:hypothetical protein